MRVVSNRIVKLDNPTPVYDATSPKHHNLTLGSGAVVHNTAKYSRFKEYQEVLKLKGKPLNSARATAIKMAENESIRNILVAVGYNADASAKAGKAQARVGTIYLLSDPDPDGPLSEDTEVFLADGTRKTMKELEELWGNTLTPFNVLSKDQNGKLVAAQAILPMVRAIVTKKIRLHFGDFHVDCSLKHKWQVSSIQREDFNPSFIFKQGLYNYVEAEFLEAGDIITGFKLNGDSFDRKITKKEFIECDEERMYCLTVPTYENFLVANKLSEDGIISSNCHINVLGLTALWKAVPQMFHEGKVRVVKAPLFSANYKGVQYFADSLEEIKQLLPKGAPSKVITRLKGWGEATVDELREIAFDPKTRKSYIIKPPKNASEDNKFFALVGDDTKARKEILGL